MLQILVHNLINIVQNVWTKIEATKMGGGGQYRRILYSRWQIVWYNHGLTIDDVAFPSSAIV